MTLDKNSYSKLSHSAINAPSPGLPSSPARFIRHPPRYPPSSFITTLSTTLTTTHNEGTTTLDITDSMAPASSQHNSSFTSLPNGSGALDDGNDSEFEPLLLRNKDQLPQLSSSHSLSLKPSISPSPTLVNDHVARSSHNPVPATQVFDRKAAPLYLPNLDAFLASLPKNPFTAEKHTLKPRMFPPMDRLAKSHQSLEDMEMNSHIPPFWRNRKTLLGSAVGLVIGLTGSSAIAMYYSLQGVVNTVQIFALILSTLIPVSGENLASQWRKLFLGTIPNVLALNFASTLTQSLIFLIIFMIVASGLFYRFVTEARHCDRYNRLEGLQQTVRGKQWSIVFVTFFLTVIYLPISIMAVHVLVWSDDLWVVSNPYTNATSFPPMVAPLGPANEYRDPLDFCWTTTMKKNEINYAPAIVTLAVTVVCMLSISFPIMLRRVIQKSVPRVDRYSELGRLRSNTDMDIEYHRVLARDQNPFGFLYSGFRRGWGTYESTYLFAKLSTLVIVAIIDPDNCATTYLYLCEWVSRMNYVTTSTVALLVVLDVPGQDILNSYVLYAIYIITYGLSFCFIRRLVKRLTRRIDFSLDVFSPRLLISFLSPHVKRRIWQESITALILTSPDCKIPSSQTMTFAQAREFEFPPYLLDFAGSPGERHVENLKILREVGSFEYRKAAALISGPDSKRYRRMEVEIQKHFVGPDSYWHDNGDLVPERSGFFGNAWYIPFPPTVVMRYDDGRLSVIHTLNDLEEYVAQNSSRAVQRKREVRMALRALEDQTVRWPYKHVMPVGSQLFCCCFRTKYRANSATQYQTCVLRVKRKGYLLWDKMQMGSGFEINLAYDKKVVQEGDLIGLTADFELSPPLARFLALNKDLIASRLGTIEASISAYRQHHQKESRHKAEVLSYRFLSHVYEQPRSANGLAHSSFEHEHDLRVRQLMAGNEVAFKTAYARLSAVSTSEAATWWYIFWDDLWRRNYDTISNLRLHETDFNPYYPSSIAYMPLPRPVLEAFLTQRGLLSTPPKRADFFHNGFLNKLYLRLNEAAFRGSGKAVFFHLGDDGPELDMDGVDLELQMEGPSSLFGTGGGTDHDDSSIIVRPAYKWEGVLSDTLHHHRWKRQDFLSKMGAWFGIKPTWRAGAVSAGVSIDVFLDNGRYVVLDDLRK
ncbi:hypothetical protein D9757_002979 [Collybiopsis confluens]|uniref:Uncharacterized protein n=1 Tax=Collybiopsis confluens TaxID=2823264 RepID=A0A8H5HVT2_9AGAR|nr:hypothetical protein D9757_002979 [Collybiopsis confluens]